MLYPPFTCAVKNLQHILDFFTPYAINSIIKAKRVRKLLKLFEVSGFKNFGSRITLDFSDVSEYKFNTSCTQNGLISKAIIYGKNSIGKSNLGLALFDIVSTLIDKNITLNLYDYYIRYYIAEYNSRLINESVPVLHYDSAKN
jgi:hypothetical protein